MSALRDRWLNLNQSTTPIRQFPPHIAEPAILSSTLGGRTPPPQDFSATAEIHPKPSGIPDSSPEIKDEPLSSPQARASTPLGLPTAPCRSARLSSKRSSALVPISFPSLDISSIPGSGNLNLQLNPSIGEGSINLQQLVDFAESQLNAEGASSQLSPNTVLGTAVIDTLSNQQEVLLSVPGRSEGSTLTKEELLTGPSANAQLILQLPAKTGETQPRNIYLGENSDTQALTDHFLRAGQSPGGSSSTTSIPSEARPENQGDFSRNFQDSVTGKQSGRLNIKNIGSTQSTHTQEDQTETVVTPRSSITGSPPQTPEEYGQRLSEGTTCFISQGTKQLSKGGHSNTQNLQTSLTDSNNLNQQIAEVREKGEQKLKETLSEIQRDFDTQDKDKETSLKNTFKQRCKQLELEQIEQEVAFETKLQKETEERKRAITEAIQQELDQFIQEKQAKSKQSRTTLPNSSFSWRKVLKLSKQTEHD